MNIVKSTTYRLMAVSSLVAVLCAAQAPAADRSDGLRSQTVSYRDLNLNTIEGATILYQRIRGAASTVCGGDAGRRLEEWQAYNSCFKHAIAQAVVKVDSPMLTAVHNGGKPSSSVTAMLNK